MEVEWWQERQIQYFKSGVKHRTTGVPELLFVGDHLIQKKLAELRSIPAVADWDSKSAPWSSHLATDVDPAAAG